MVMGEGPYYRERQKGRGQCKECGEEMALVSMAGHMRTQQGRAAEGICRWSSTPPGKELQTYRMASPTAGGLRNCPVEGCPGRAVMWTAMRVNFIHRNVQDNVVILEEGNLPHPRCPQCDMLVPWRALNMRHLATAQCARGGGVK